MDSYVVGSDLSTAEKLQGGIPMVYETLPSVEDQRKTMTASGLKTAKAKKSTRPVHSMKAMYCSLAMCSILWAILGLSYLLFDPIVKHLVLKRLVLRNDSDFAAIWRNPPIKPHFKVYFFNLTNPEEFFQGKAAPHVKEVGPYTYHQKWIKENVKWHNDGTMSYSTRKEFSFVPELSVGDHSKDQITLANVPAISAMYQNRYASYFSKWGMELVSVLVALRLALRVRSGPGELSMGLGSMKIDISNPLVRAHHVGDQKPRRIRLGISRTAF